VIFHDAIRTDSNAHLECIYAADVQGFTVRNSQFRNCAIMDLFITKLSGVNPRDVLIENNFFDITGSHGGSPSKGYYSLVVANHLDNATNFTIRNNSFAESMSIDSGSLSNFNVEGKRRAAVHLPLRRQLRRQRLDVAQLLVVRPPGRLGLQGRPQLRPPPQRGSRRRRRDDGRHLTGHRHRRADPARRGPARRGRRRVRQLDHPAAGRHDRA
jgi:hypothetical protein